ncbi:MAG: thiamine-binding protein [Sphingobacteriia bacterium]|jgi:uncharacterized protein YqgV (UPF0045/DUF77 family)
MHSHTICATIQILPLAQDKHPYEWVDEAIPIIINSGIQYDVRSFATEIEGTYAEVMQVIQDVNEHLYQKGCAEWITNIQIQIRADRAISAIEKTEKYHI